MGASDFAFDALCNRTLIHSQRSSLLATIQLIEPTSKRTLPGASTPCILSDNLAQASFVLLNDQSSSPSEEINAGRVEASAHDRGASAGIIRLQLYVFPSCSAIIVQWPTLTLLGRADFRNDACLGQNPVPARTIKSLSPYPSESSMNTWIVYKLPLPHATSSSPHHDNLCAEPNFGGCS